MSKYEDLMVDIENDDTFDMTRSEIVGARVALQWLDQNGDRVPGRTILASQVESETKGMPKRYVEGYMDALEDSYTAVVPDPKPTNAERIKAWLEMAQKDNAAQSYTRFAEYLDQAGVVAPGGENDGR